MAINQRKAGTILSYVYIFLSNSISLVYTPIFLRMLGQSEYGLIGTASSLTSYLSLLSMGVGASYIRFNAKVRTTGNKEDEYRMNGMFQAIYIVISIVTLIIGTVLVFSSSFIFSANYSSSELFEIKMIMICTVLQFVVTFMFNTTAMAMQAYEKYLFLKLCQIVACIVQPCVNLLVLYLGGRAVAISVISLCVSIATYLSYYYVAKKMISLRFVFNNFDKKVIKSIFVFSSYLFLNSVTNQITTSTDTMVLSVTSGPVLVAIYVIGQQFYNYFSQFSTSVSNVFSPQINKIVAENRDKSELDAIFIKVGRVQFYIVTLILSGYIFFGQQFISLWAGEDYHDSYLIGLFLIISAYVPCFQNVGLEIQRAKNLHKARSVVYFLIAIVNCGITIPLAMIYHGAGAAFATMVCMFFGTVIFMNIYNYKKVGIDIPSFWKSIIKITPGLIIPIVCGILILLFAPINSFLVLILFILLYCVVYFLSIWVLSMNRYEKDLFISPLRKIGRKIIIKLH